MSCNDRVSSDAGVTLVELLVEQRNNTNRIVSAGLPWHPEGPTLGRQLNAHTVLQPALLRNSAE